MSVDERMQCTQLQQYGSWAHGWILATTAAVQELDWGLGLGTESAREVREREYRIARLLEWSIGV